MMSLLSVTVKKARYVGVQASQFNTYVTLKLQNVKSTTVTVKGATPCWEQDFLFETNDLNTGLLIEVWSKGMIWDRAMGYHWIPLQTVQYSNEEGSGQWLSLEAELVMRDGEVVGTKSPTGHSLLVDCRFELPFDPENIEASDLQRKLEMLNNIMDQEARLEQARRQMQYFGHSGYSEDSDYTSDLNYPVGQHANSSASQFRAAAHQIHTPQRSLETSRENSYERDDGPGQQHHLSASLTFQQHLSPGSHRKHQQKFSTEDYTNYGRQYQQENSTDFDPLFYNSRPRNKPDYSSQETWASCETSFYNQSMDSMDGGYSISSDYCSTKPFRSKARRPSLERQTTLYDDSTFYNDPNFYPNDITSEINCVNVSTSFNQNQSYEEYFDSLSYPFQEERYGQDEEDRQWDSGGYPPPIRNHTKKLPSIPLQKRRLSNDFDRSTPTVRRKMPQIPSKRCNSRQSDGNSSHRGASLPPTPTKTPKILPKPTKAGFNSLPPTPGRQLPKPNLNHRSAKVRRSNLMKRTSSAEYENNFEAFYVRPGAMSAKEMYNEDYNYAYQSIDNLPAQPEEGNGKVEDFLRRNGINGKMHNALPYQSQSIDDYYYNAQEDYHDPDQNYFEASTKQPIVLQQITDSLESRDEDLRGSYEPTVTSSVTTTIPRDQSPKTPSIPPLIIPNVTVVQVHNNTTPKSVRGLLKQQDSVVDVTYLNQTPITNSFEQETYHDANDILEPQESIESYVEDIEEPIDDSYPTKAIKTDSPSSVIHIDDDHPLRRGSSQITVVDPYHPRRSSMLERRTSVDLNQDESFLPRKSSGEVSRRDSLQVERDIPEEQEGSEKKSVSFEEEEDVKQLRPQVTAQQRWHWAYNKIIMQLNISEKKNGNHIVKMTFKVLL